ncbi:hypothetical protein EPR50_G00227230 [Perca flavescens]|uniref:CIP2A N-terminal domain-containing protein n=1 Tax=Perca flavescens TaxID=8167 RepID=A0A484C1Y1_PERFV|nr:hypothetical protein EPR50_G00227230 [Perca flavescens]
MQFVSQIVTSSYKISTETAGQRKTQRSYRNKWRRSRALNVTSCCPQARFCPGSVGGLVELAGNPNTSQTLTSSIISLLAKLACDDDSREILNSSYNLTSTLASVIHCHSATAGEPLVLQCLQVLQKLTYNTQGFPVYKLHP